MIRKIIAWLLGTKIKNVRNKTRGFFYKEYTYISDVSRSYDQFEKRYVIIPWIDGLKMFREPLCTLLSSKHNMSVTRAYIFIDEAFKLSDLLIQDCLIEILNSDEVKKLGVIRVSNLTTGKFIQHSLDRDINVVVDSTLHNGITYISEDIFRELGPNLRGKRFKITVVPNYYEIKKGL